MIIRCTKCSTEFDLDPSQVGPEGVTLRCSVCSHMFHAEPDEPEADLAGGPWRLATGDKRLFELPTLHDIVEQIADGRLHPDDQISHTGQHWLRLGEIPEFSPLFLGQEGLPRMFRAIDSPSALELGPPPTFGTGVDDPEPLRREETIRFDLGNDPLPEPALPIVDDDSPLPAPPQFDTRPTEVPPQRMRAQRRTTEGASSMLDAVTKAVSSDVHERVDDDDDVPRAGSRERSQPILVSDLARAAAQNVAAAVQRVEGQRASERAARETVKAPGRVESSRGASESSSSRAGDSDASDRRLRDDSQTSRPDNRSATAAAVTAAVASVPVAATSQPAASQPAASQPAVSQSAVASAVASGVASGAGQSASASASGSPPTEPSHVAHASITAPDAPRAPEVVIVKVTEPAQNRGAAGVYALAAVLVALGIMFGVPGIRERIYNLGGDPPDAVKGEPKATQPEPSEFAAARSAARTLGLAKTRAAITDLERIVDDREREPAVIAAAKLAQAELMLLRVLSHQIAMSLEPDNRELPIAVDADLADASALLEGLEGADANQLARVRALLALAQGSFNADALTRVTAPELRTLALGAVLWRDTGAPVPNGLITSLQGVPNPTSLHQTLLALALWRSGDDEGARRVLDGVLGRVSDMAAAIALRAALDRSAAEKGETLPPPPEPPTDSGDPSTPPEDPIRSPGDTSPRTTSPRPTGGPAESTDALVTTGCQKVRSGDPDGGIKLLLQAHDKPGGSRHLELCLCLGTGFLAKNNYDPAFSWFKRAAGQAPHNREAVGGAARAAELAGKHGVAVEYYRKLLEIEPGNQTARNYLAKHDNAGKAPPPDDPGDLLPVGKKK